MNKKLLLFSIIAIGITRNNYTMQKHLIQMNTPETTELIKTLTSYNKIASDIKTGNKISLRSVHEIKQKLQNIQEAESHSATPNTDFQKVCKLHIDSLNQYLQEQITFVSIYLDNPTHCTVNPTCEEIIDYYTSAKEGPERNLRKAKIELFLGRAFLESLVINEPNIDVVRLFQQVIYNNNASCSNKVLAIMLNIKI